MPTLRRAKGSPGYRVEDDAPGRPMAYQITTEGEQFLAGILGLRDGDEVRPQDLQLLIDRLWAVPIDPAPPPEPPRAPAPPSPPRPVGGKPPTPRRSRAREIALQLLYMLEQNPAFAGDEVEGFLERRLRDPKLRDFARALVEGVRAHQPRIDELISGAASNWRLDRMAAIDRNILRLGAFEMLYEPSVPVKVAINEALELAKRYSTAQSSRFVNGILDRLQGADPNPPATPPEEAPGDTATTPTEADDAGEAPASDG